MSKSASQRTAILLLLAMALVAGGAALRESATVDEFAHVGAGLSYWQRLDLRLNGEHPPLGKLLAGVSMALAGVRADYASPAWRASSDFFYAYGAQFAFGDAVLGRWNDWRSTIFWARLPMLLLTLVLGWVVYRYATRIGGPVGGLLCLAMYVTTPAMLVFGPLVLTDLPVTLFTLIALWRLGEIWAAPSRRNALLFGLAFGASLLSKFTGVLLIPVIGVLFLRTRFRPTAGEPPDRFDRKKWRRERRLCIRRGAMWAAVTVYAVYFVFSLGQPDNPLSLIGGGSWAWVLRRPLMPIWLFARGFLMMLATGVRPTFILGHAYSHGVPYYFPALLLLKSTLGFLAVLGIAAIGGIILRKRGEHVIPEDVRPHWRVLTIGFYVFLTICLLSQMDISIRHFMMPITLLIVMLAPLPRVAAALPGRRVWQLATAAAVIASFVTIGLADPYFMPFTNSLAFGHPIYQLANDSNVSWNEALPEVEQFARDQHMSEIALDWASMSDPALVVPQARPWDCQEPTEREAGQWVAVAAVSIRENHNCAYLEQYPQKQLGGGSFYLFHLPSPIPVAGQAGGPPVASDRKVLWGMPLDLRSVAIDMERHPERLVPRLEEVGKKFQEASPMGKKR